MEKTAVFYGPSKGSVSKIAHKIVQKLGPSKCDLHWVKECEASDLEPYANIIFGISTIGRNNWDADYNDDDWDVFETKLSEVDWTGKQVAIFCLGDQVTYPNNFADALGWLYEKMEKLNVLVVGMCDSTEYNFDDSEGIRDGQFVGLPLDEDTQAELSNERLDRWLLQLKNNGF